MKTYLLLTGLILLPACGGGEGGEATESGNEEVSTASSDIAPAMPEVSTAKLPFDMPIMDGARYISGSPKFSKPSKRRGGEAIATIAVKGTPVDVTEYYAKALTERGFTPTQGVNNSESSAKVEGVNAAGEKFAVTVMRGGSKSQAGESTAALVATKPKPSQ